MTTPATLDCPCCGGDLFTADEDGLFYEDTEATCPECALIATIGVDGDIAYVSHDEMHADVGQPKCDGSCGALPAWVGTPGNPHDCERCRRPAPHRENRDPP